MIDPLNPPDIPAWQQLQSRLQQAGHRRLVLLEGDREAALAWLSRCLPGLPVAPGVWVGSDGASAINGITPIAAKQARRWLGQDLNAVIWDGWQGNPPDGLAALAGTLSAGGLFFWLMPPLADWASFDDPDYHRLGLDGSEAHPFLARLARILAKDGSVIRIQPGQRQIPVLSAPELPDHPFQLATTAEQARLIEQIIKVGLGRRRRPLVITADRGRGKSAALGMAAKALVERGRERILVTANDPSAVETLLSHARGAGDDQVAFWSIDDLLEQRPEAELVMVDEAASIPPYRLKQILLGWPRVVFATTVHGYEGAGRGFSVRFRSVLDRETPHWKQASLKAPIRWSTSDPLEPLFARLFLLGTAAPEAPEVAASSRSDLTVERWHPAAARDQQLGESFGLLVDAHYRTTPGDLRQWMDDPSAASWVAKLSGQVVGVIWATTEGGLDEDLAREVMMGRRRVRGHLLPQSLASHAGFAEAAQQRFLRVVRVAVSPEARHQGIGRALVKAAETYARQQGLDALGTSFGGTVALLRFWQQAGLTPIRPGLSREASSGELPLQMLLGLSPSGTQLTDNLRGRLAEHWLTLVPRLWSELDAKLVLRISASLGSIHELNDDDRRDLNSFAYGHRGFDLTLPVLQRLTLTPGFAPTLQAQTDGGLPELWAGSVLQGWSWARLQAAGLCLGREQGEARLRNLVQNLL